MKPPPQLAGRRLEGRPRKDAKGSRPDVSGLDQAGHPARRLRPEPGSVRGLEACRAAAGVELGALYRRGANHCFLKMAVVPLLSSRRRAPGRAELDYRPDETGRASVRESVCQSV